MPRRASFGPTLLVLLCVSALAEKRPPEASPAGLIELPVVMQQKVAAGITKVGTKVQAKLTISTLVHGTVVPRDAVLSGEVIESAAKTADSSSKLGIRMDTAKWKNGSLPVKVYLTEWYYPIKAVFPEDNETGYSAIHGSVGITMGGGSYPSPGNPNGGRRISDDDPYGSQFPPNPGTENTPAGNASPHRVRMRDVESMRDEGGAITISSKKTSLKLDKSTTYVLATDDLSP